ncbi:hypothetical protein BH10PSE17_BH10PSE17_27500 [soil metagenome]
MPSELTTLRIDDSAYGEIKRFYDQLEGDDSLVSLIRTGADVEQVWIDKHRADFLVKGEPGWDIGGWSPTELFGDRTPLVQLIRGIRFGFESEDFAHSLSGQVLHFNGHYFLTPA